jgi:hypothetical protein
MSVKKALDSYFRSQARKATPRTPRGKNKQPEKEVVLALMAYLKGSGFSCHVVEAKAVFSQRAGRYLRSQADPGMSDILGATPQGVGCFIEVKAPGRRRTLRENQREFLLGKIQIGAFAVCVESVEEFVESYRKWSNLVKSGASVEAKSFLMNCLPKSKGTDDLDL